MENGFQGRDGENVPEMTDEFIHQVSERYIELYENITGEKFIRADVSDVVKRVEANITECLKTL